MGGADVLTSGVRNSRRATCSRAENPSYLLTAAERKTSSYLLTAAKRKTSSYLLTAAKRKTSRYLLTAAKRKTPSYLLTYCSRGEERGQPQMWRVARVPFVKCCDGGDSSDGGDKSRHRSKRYTAA